MNLKDDEIIAPTHSHLFAAVGAALNAKEEVTTDFEHLLKQFEKKIELQQEVDRLEPLFKNDQEYKSFVKDHNRHVVKRGDLTTYKGNCYLGIDAGSTTTKVALAGEDGELLYSSITIITEVRFTLLWKHFMKSTNRCQRLLRSYLPVPLDMENIL